MNHEHLLLEAADNVRSHVVTRLVDTEGCQIWRCMKPNGSSIYAFDIVITRFGMVVFGDIDPLIFKVGSSYGIEFLARKTVCGYMISKLAEESRNKDELDIQKLRNYIAACGARWITTHFHVEEESEESKFVEKLSDGEAGEGDHLKRLIAFVENEPWGMMREIEKEQLKSWVSYAEQVTDDATSAEKNELYDILCEHRDVLKLGDFEEENFYTYSTNLWVRLEMVRLCALKAKEILDADPRPDIE